jgi:hypothetical protein
MNDIDQKIQAALRRASPGAPADEPNLAEEVLIAFRGRHTLLTVTAFAISLAFLALAIWAGYHFYVAAAVREQLWWGALGLLAVLGMSFVKVWFWLEMQTNRVLRELKRVELLLVTRLPGGDAK